MLTEALNRFACDVISSRYLRVPTSPCEVGHLMGYVCSAISRYETAKFEEKRG
jgi:hypothetical protein